MDLRHLFLRYSFAFNLVLLFVLAWVSAGVVNQALANRVTKSHGQPVAMGAAPEPAPEFTPDSAAIAKRDIFQAGGSTSKPQDGGTAEANPGETQLRLKLLAVLFFGTNSARNIATIQNLADQKSDVYRTGMDVVPGAKLAEVQVDRVVLDRGNGRMEELMFETAGGPAATVAAAEPARTRKKGREGRESPEENPAAGVQQVSDTDFVVQKAAISGALNNMSSLMTQARIIPNFTQGQGEERKVDGFRIFRIKSDSVFKALGLNDGDVIKSINGEPMDSLEKGLNMLKGLSGMTQFSIQIERQREPRTHNYKVQ